MTHAVLAKFINNEALAQKQGHQTPSHLWSWRAQCSGKEKTGGKFLNMRSAAARTMVIHWTTILALPYCRGERRRICPEYPSTAGGRPEQGIYSCQDKGHESTAPLLGVVPYLQILYFSHDIFFCFSDHFGDLG
jgi:hypothetical protein